MILVTNHPFSSDAFTKGQFELRLNGAALPASDECFVASCDLNEGASRPTRAVVRLFCSAPLDERRLLDQVVTLQAKHGALRRTWALVVEQIEYAGFRDQSHHYVLFLTHALALLGRRFDTRAFQKRTLRVIVEEVLDMTGISASQIVWKLNDDPERKYLVQYCESDLAFLQRILGEEGVSYYTRHVNGKPCVLFCDESGDVDSPDLGDLQLIDGAHGEGVTDFDFESSVESDLFTTGDYDYQQANTDLTQAVAISEASSAEWYEYPGGYLDAGRGATLAKRRAEARVSYRDSATGRSECVRLEPGKRFTLTRIGGGELKWNLVEVSHRWVLRPEPGRARDESSYSNQFRCVPWADFYREVWPTLSRTVEGPLGAVVTTQGEEIQTDAYGEATVRFFWDRLNPPTDVASCWLRVIQLPIGGSLAVARKQWEILSRHLYGDPNRPILVARLDNANHPAPYAYPGAGTAMAWKTLASPGAAKLNEFSMEDSGGGQGFNMTAGTDYTCLINNELSETVGVNEEVCIDVEHDTTVGADQKTSIGTAWTKSVSKDAQMSVTSDRTLKIGSAETVTVSGSLSQSITGKDSEMVGANHMALAGMNVSKTSIGSQSLTVGGAYITAAGLGVSQAVGGMKTEMVGGAKIVAAGGGISESVLGAYSNVVGGVLLQTAGGDYTSTTSSASSVKVGGAVITAGSDQVQLSAKKITIQVGGAAALVGGGGVLALTAGSASFVGMVTIKASGTLKIKGAPNLPG